MACTIFGSSLAQMKGTSVGMPTFEDVRKDPDPPGMMLQMIKVPLDIINLASLLCYQ